MEFECLTAGMSTIETPPLAAPVPELSILSQTAESSVIRDLLRLVAQSDVLSLAGGLPAPSCLPTERIAEAASRVLAADLSGGLEHPLQYSPTAGMARLFDALSHRGWLRTPDALITTGSQQALDLLGAALLDAGDAIVMAVPSYLGAIQAFGAYRPRIVGVAADDQGLDTEDLARLLADGLRPKFVYVVSQFANPDGATLSDMRRRELARLADHYGFFILDDDPYGQLRFAGGGLVPLAELSDRVITMGSASKVLAPGLRVGWTEGPVQVVEAMTRLKQARDLHTSSLSQAIAADIFGDDAFVFSHLARVRETYRQSADVLSGAIEDAAAAFDMDVRWREPQGGMFLWLTVPGVDTTELLAAAIKCGVAFVPGAAFAPRGDQHQGTLGESMRLCYSTLGAESLHEATERLFTAATRTR